jgi:hypothetical protein
VQGNVLSCPHRGVERYLSKLTMYHVDISAAGSRTRDIKEEDVILSEGHHRLVTSCIWRLSYVHPLDWSRIGSF